jgi:alpha-glucosidase
MGELPDWVHRGVIVSVQGGSEAAEDKLEKLTSAKVPLAGLWNQDWSGNRTTPGGKQLWWDWHLDETLYPGWRKMVEALERQGARNAHLYQPIPKQ